MNRSPCHTPQQPRAALHQVMVQSQKATPTPQLPLSRIETGQVQYARASNDYRFSHAVCANPSFSQVTQSSVASSSSLRNKNTTSIRPSIGSTAKETNLKSSDTEGGCQECTAVCFDQSERVDCCVPVARHHRPAPNSQPWLGVGLG